MSATSAAQPSGSIEGLVLNSITGQGVEGVEVTMFTRQAVRYKATTDAAGAFRVTGVAPGAYQGLLEKEGYFAGPPMETAYTVGPGLDAPHPRFYVTRDVAVRGRVLDPRGDPAANVRVSLSGLGILTNEQGEFEITPVPPGIYTLLATPPVTDQPIQAIPTYSQKIVVRDQDIEQIQIRLQESDVYRITGVVLGPTGDPVPMARVLLQPIVQREPMASGSPILSISGSFRGAGATESTVTADEQGRFEFFPVRSGDWFVNAQVTGSIEAADFAQRARVGSEEVRMGRADVEGVRIRLQEPFDFIAHDVRLTPVSGNGIAAIPQIGGRRLLPGTYILEPGPRIGEYMTSIRLDGREVMGLPVPLISSTQKIEVTTQPARGAVQGKVIGDAGTVVLIPTQQTGYGYTARVEADGSFSINGVAPGDYSVAAITGYDRRRGLTLEASQLQRVITLGTRVRVTQDGTATVELRPLQWLE